MSGPGSVQSDAYLGQADVTDPTHLFNAISFMVNQIMNGKWTVTIGQVKAVNGGGTDGPPTVNVQPMVHMIDGYGQPTPHGIINNLLAFRLQGGTGGIVCDSVVGDIGLLAFASRDISKVVNTKAPALPGSRRTFDPADGIFFGGLLGAALTQFINFTSTGIAIQDKNGNVITTGSSGIAITVVGDFTVNGISVLNHTHAVTTAPGETGPPVG
jgi:hypothetical protein